MASALERALQAGEEPTRQAIAVQGRSQPGKVTGKLRAALEAMVWKGLRRGEAAQAAGLAEVSLQLALAKPHVKQWYLGQLEVLRTSARARNIHRLEEIRDAANNMPAVQAIKTLEQIDDVSTGTAAMQRAPGLQIVITQVAAPVTNPTVIDAEPVQINNC
jgi:hypothetical protein